MALLQVGDVFAGYRIEADGLRGGMGVVYRATQLRLQRPVALKLIAPALAEDPAFRTRFKRESDSAASIDHPNVIPIYDAAEHDGELYIAMRWVTGTDLRETLVREGRLAPRRAAAIVEQIAAALDAAHERGLVHRDVKPANVVVDKREHVYLTDFGIARAAGAQSATRGVGTMDYMAPEQFDGRPLGPAADIYALGCLLYELLTGEVPYPHDNDAAKLHAHLNTSAPKPSARAPVPPAFDGVVARAMAKDPGDRYPSAGGLAKDANAAAGDVAPSPRPEPQPVPPGPPPPGPTRVDPRPGPTRADIAVEPQPPPRRRSRGMLKAGAGVAALVLGAAVISRGIETGGGGGSPPPPPAPPPLPPAAPDWDGSYSGTTDQGKSISFMVQDNVAGSFELPFVHTCRGGSYPGPGGTDTHGHDDRTFGQGRVDDAGRLVIELNEGANAYVIQGKFTDGTASGTFQQREINSNGATCESGLIRWQARG